MPISKAPLCRFGCAYVEWIHDELVNALWRGTDPVAQNEYRDLNLLDSALGRPFQSACGQDAYPGVIQKSAALFHSLVSNHPFHNGNKRTAVIAVDAFLLANGYALALSNEAVYKLAQDTASYRSRGTTHEQAFHQIETQLREHSVSLDVFYREQRKDKSLAELYAAGIRLRRFVRRRPENSILI